MPIVRAELEALVAAGCADVCVDEPSMSCYAHREDPRRFVSLFNDTVEGVRSLAAHEVELRFAAPVDPAPFQAIEGVANLASEGRALRMLVTGPIAPVVRLAGRYELVDFVSREPSLEEVDFM